MLARPPLPSLAARSLPPSLPAAVGLSRAQVVDASKQNADLGDESEEAKAQGALDAERLAPVLAFLERAVGPAVERVELSRRLTASPAAIVQPQWGMSPQMERFMRAQAVALGKEDEMLGSMGAQGSTAILEINANHPVIAKLAALVAADAESPEALQFGMLVYEVAAVTSGYEIADPGAFAKRVTKMMADGQTMSAAAPAPAAVSSSGVTPVEIVE
jgi:heat shock protein beta